MDTDKPIGIFDSGVGGLTVLKELIRELPNEPFVYFGDTARVPYGSKSKETITRFSVENTHFLRRFGVKIVIVACHTSSSLALEALEANFAFPVIGVVEPGAKKAAELTKNGRVGVIGTRATVSSGSYERVLRCFDSKLRIFSEACPLFVSLVEEGWLSGEVVEKIVRTYLEPLIANGVDTLVLGCTHYPMLEPVIRKVMTDKVLLVNPAVETAREAARLLGEQRLLRKGASGGDRLKFFVSDEPTHFQVLGERFLGEPIPIVARVTE